MQSNGGRTGSPIPKAASPVSRRAVLLVAALCILERPHRPSGSLLTSIQSQCERTLSNEASHPVNDRSLTIWDPCGCFGVPWIGCCRRRSADRALCGTVSIQRVRLRRPAGCNGSLPACTCVRRRDLHAVLCNRKIEFRRVRQRRLHRDGKRRYKNLQNVRCFGLHERRRLQLWRDSSGNLDAHVSKERAKLSDVQQPGSMRGSAAVSSFHLK